jgi:hypothetical protein
LSLEGQVYPTRLCIKVPRVKDTGKQKTPSVEGADRKQTLSV